MPDTGSVNNYTVRKTVVTTVNTSTTMTSDSAASAGPGTNILNSYRSVSYNFTLAALTKSEVNDLSTLNTANPSFIVATTKGKGTTSQNAAQSLKAPTIPATVAASSNDITASSNVITQVPASNPNLKVQQSNLTTAQRQALTEIKNQQAQKQLQIDINNQQTALNTTRDLLNGFNKSSSGRFDLFIDNVEVESTFTFNDDNGTSTPWTMSFEVYEPYGLNGLFEALQVGAKVGGYSDYISGSFVMIMEFMGYPDKPAGITDPVDISEATRVFPIRIIDMEISVDERGSVYKISATPIGERSYGTVAANTKSRVSATGSTVKEFLTDLISGINRQQADEAKNVNATEYDTYEILFPVYDANGKINTGVDNKIASAKYDPSSDLNKGMDDIDQSAIAGADAYGSVSISSNTAGSNGTNSSGKHSAQFEGGTPIPAIISAAIRDSRVASDIIKEFYTGPEGQIPASVDANGMIDYFIIIPQITETPNTLNKVTNRPITKFTYLVQPYKVLYNKVVPGQGRSIINDRALKKIALRQYNYVYTGQNVDILDFKINFKSLFFEELPKNLANPQQGAPATDTIAPTNDPKIVRTPTVGATSAITNDVGRPQQQSMYGAGINKTGGGINASIPDGSAYQQMVKVMHDSIVGSQSLAQATIGISGDPYYLTAGGSGNYPTKNNVQGLYAGSKEAAISAGQVLIYITWRNPIDIGNNGFMTFDNNTIAFSGLYVVVSVRSEFKDGSFKQTLELQRVPGQPQTSNQIPDIPGKGFTGAVDPGNISQTSTEPPTANGVVNTNNGSAGTPATTINLTSQGVAPSGIPTPGGLGGNSNATVPGGMNPVGNLSLTNGIQPNQLATGLRALSNGINLAQISGLGVAPTVNAVSNLLGGVGKTSSVAALASNIDANLTQQLTNNKLSYAITAGAGAINNVQNTINNTLNSPLSSVANAFGINANGITGITGILSSKALTNLQTIAANVPSGVNMQQASNQGILLGNLTTFANIPATTPVSYGLTDGGYTSRSLVQNNTNLAQLPNPLDNPLQPAVASVAQSANLSAAATMFGQVTGAASNPVSTLLAVNNSLGINSGNLASSVNSQFGSNNNNNVTSPLFALVNNNNPTST